jgi:hypothetical protein
VEDGGEVPRATRESAREFCNRPQFPLTVRLLERGVESLSISELLAVVGSRVAQGSLTATTSPMRFIRFEYDVLCSQFSADSRFRLSDVVREDRFLIYKVARNPTAPGGAEFVLRVDPFRPARSQSREEDCRCR